MECNEVLGSWVDHNLWLCHAERYTKHYHAEPAAYIRPLPKGATIALTDDDCLVLVEVEVE